MLKRTALFCVVLWGVLGIVRTASAAVIMDATTHNGSFNDRAVGTYWNNVSTNPAEWFKSGSHVYNGALFLQSYAETEIYNNTGEAVTPGMAYTLSADLGDTTGAKIDVFVRATQNADGSGASVDLAHVTRTGTSPNSPDYTLYTTTSTGAGAGAGLAGYYIQVKAITDASVAGQGYYLNNIVVTSDVVVPEPASLGALAMCGAIMLARRCRV